MWQEAFFKVIFSFTCACVFSLLVLSTSALPLAALGALSRDEKLFCKMIVIELPLEVA